MDKVLDGFKTVLENFAKQTSLNILLFTGVITSGFMYWRTSNDVALYVAFGCLIFLIMNLLVKYIPKWNEKRQEKRFTKRLNNPKLQKKFLSNLYEYDLEVLQDLSRKIAPNKISKEKMLRVIVCFCLNLMTL